MLASAMQCSLKPLMYVAAVDTGGGYSRLRGPLIKGSAGKAVVSQ